VPFAAGSGPASVTVADFNNDGFADLAVTGAGGSRVLLGNGDGTFRTSTISYGSAGVALLARDFNGDGQLDLAVALPDYDRVALLFNDGSGRPGPVPGSAPRKDTRIGDEILFGQRTIPSAQTAPATIATPVGWTPAASRLLTAGRVEQVFTAATLQNRRPVAPSAAEDRGIFVLDFFTRF
jgi:hypothetical protein